MKFLFLKFCYGVEIGAYWAYRGHHRVTKDQKVLFIAKEELKHMVLIQKVLTLHKQKPAWFFNLMFYIIGKSVYGLCFVSPFIALNLVAGFLEKLNVLSYTQMARLFPEHGPMFEHMQQNENDHEVYFLNQVFTKEKDLNHRPIEKKF